MEQSVDGGGGERPWHQLVEPGRMNVTRQRDRSFLVGGVDDANERLGRVGRHREQADVIQLCGYPESARQPA